MTRAEIHEGLSRGVVAGIVRSWSWAGAQYHVYTADGHHHQYNTTQAGAFADAIFATEATIPRGTHPGRTTP